MGLAVSLTPPAYHARPSCAWQYIIVTSPKSRWLGIGTGKGDLVVVYLGGVMMSLDHSAKMDRGGVWRSPGCWEGVDVKHHHPGLFWSRFSLGLYPEGTV